MKTYVISVPEPIEKPVMSGDFSIFNGLSHNLLLSFTNTERYVNRRVAISMFYELSKDNRAINFARIALREGNIWAVYCADAHWLDALDNVMLECEVNLLSNSKLFDAWVELAIQLVMLIGDREISIKYLDQLLAKDSVTDYAYQTIRRVYNFLPYS